MKIIGLIMIGIGWFLIGFNWGTKKEVNLENSLSLIILILLINTGYFLMYN